MWHCSVPEEFHACVQVFHHHSLEQPQTAVPGDTYIPSEIAQIRDSEDTVLDLGGVIGGVPGGIPGGTARRCDWGIVGSVPSYTQPPPPTEPIRIGGQVQAPRLLQRIEPVYPSFARAARFWGDVIIDAIIDTQGKGQQLQVVSGHPLLTQSALATVGNWVYEPSYLNGQPVPVILTVTVRFRSN